MEALNPVVLPAPLVRVTGSVLGAPGERLAFGATVLLILAAFALRITLALVLSDIPPVSDGAHYDSIARSLLDGRGFGEAPGFPTSHRPPLQPAWLAAAYALMGPSPRAGAIAGAVSGGLGVLAIALLGAGLGGARAAVWSAGIACVYPRLLDYSIRLWSLSEGLGVAVFAGAVAAWVACERGHRFGAPLSGLLFGLAALCRPVFLFFPGLLILRAGAGRRRQVAVALAVFLVSLAPWTVRNFTMHGRLVPVSTMGGIVFYQGFHPPAEGWGFTPWEEIWEVARDAKGETGQSDALIAKTMRDIAADPVAAARLLPAKLVWLASPFSEQDGFVDPVLVAIAALGLMAAAALAREPRAWIPIAALFYVPGFALVFYGSPRFRLPLEPILIALASAWVPGALRVASRRILILAVIGASVALAVTPGIDRRTARQVAEALIGPLPGHAPDMPEPEPPQADEP